MEGKSTDWVRGPSGPTVCRCCFTEGCYKDISTEYFWMGKREVYCEMLTETFDLSIAFAQTSGPNSNSRLICEPCISRLRDASEFKRQVQECEKMFMQYLDPGRTTVDELQMETTQEPLEKGVKLEPVKLEKNHSDDDFDDRGGFDDMDEDDLDDQPLTRLASKVPKKESVDLLDLLDNAKAEKRKSSTKTKSSPAKKAKTKKETPKATASKAKPEKKKKDIKSVSSGTVRSNHSIERRNAEIIIQYATAFPFRLPEKSLLCVYCCEDFEDPSLFRKHMDDEHQQFKVAMAFAHVSEGDLKVDCTDLQCRTCFEPFSKLDDIAEHLFNVHNYPLDLNYHLGLQPFTLYKHVLLCAVCEVKYPCLRTLSKHTQTHFVRFTCETCGKSYSMTTSLNAHRKFCKSSGPVCRKCLRVFPSLDARREHYKHSDKCRQHMCNKCGERFYTWNLKQQHLLDVHKQEKMQHSCPECNATFSSRSSFSVHFKITHTNNYIKCTYCERRFDTEKNLKRHIVGHTGEKSFPCPVCSKTFPRKNNLIQHMWIHNADKRFECKLCNKQFTQKISWKTHMRSHHPELYDNLDFNQPVKSLRKDK